MIRRPPRSTRTDTLFPYTTLFRSVLGGDRDRLAQPQRIGFAEPGFRCAALALVGDQGDRLAAATQPVGEVLVERRDAGARVEQQQRQVGLAKRFLGLLAHACLEAGVEALLQARGVHHAELEPAEIGPALAADRKSTR